MTNFTNSMYVGFTNPSEEFLPVVLPRSILNLCISWSWGLSVLIKLLFGASTSTNALYSNLFSMRSLFLGLSHGFSSPADCRRSFGSVGIGFLIRRSAPCFDLLTTSSEIISSWWVFETQALRCLIVLVYSMNIPFYILCTSYLKHFLEKICILISLWKI